MVRTATSLDIPRIAEIHVYGWRYAYAGLMDEILLYANRTVAKQIEQHLATQQYWHDALVFEQNGVIKGFSFAGPSRSDDKKNAWELYAIYVEPAFKFQGVGSSLVGRTAELARERKEANGAPYRELILWVLEQNAEGQRFYVRQGFTPDGGRLHDDDLKLDEIRMSKLL